MTIDDAHATLTREAFLQDPSATNAQALIILLHTHHIYLNGPCLADRPAVTELSALTQRDAAQVVASIWPPATDRLTASDLYFLFNQETPYEVIDDVPEKWNQRIETLRQKILQHPLVHSVKPED